MKTKLFVLLCSLFSTVAIQAQIFEVDGLTYEVTSSFSHKVKMVLGDKEAKQIIIPSMVKYNGIQYDVTSIGNEAFEDCSSLISVVFPESLESIGDYAFEDCSSLTSVIFPESLKSIGDYAFNDCSSLTSIVFPKSLKSIGTSAFSDCI